MPNNRLPAGTPRPTHAIRKFASLTASRDVEVIKATILDKYGFEVTNKYAADLIAFVEALTDGQQGG